MTRGSLVISRRYGQARAERSSCVKSPHRPWQRSSGHRLTGAGGGALMTPMLVLLFGIKPSTALSTDLVAAVVMRSFGAAVHLRKGTVHRRLVGWLVVGSVPMALVGSHLLYVMGEQKSAQANTQHALGAALLCGTAAMMLRYVLDRRHGVSRRDRLETIMLRPLATVLIGMLGGLIVGITSVGSGSLILVLLLFVYPRIGANRLVGTDLVLAVPLTGAAAIGALNFGHVVSPVTAAMIIGGVSARSGPRGRRITSRGH